MLGQNGLDNSEERTQDVFAEVSATANGVVPHAQDAVCEEYAASKWVAERFLENVYTTRIGLCAWIHRPSSIMPAAAGVRACWIIDGYQSIILRVSISQRRAADYK
jgi:hypothetical protein